MKNKQSELDVYFIGGQKPMTNDEEHTIDRFLKENKEKQSYRKIKSKTTKKRKRLA